jgi:hypothetical protein
MQPQVAFANAQNTSANRFVDHLTKEDSPSGNKTRYKRF